MRQAYLGLLPIRQGIPEVELIKMNVPCPGFMDGMPRPSKVVVEGVQDVLIQIQLVMEIYIQNGYNLTEDPFIPPTNKYLTNLIIYTTVIE